ncbi:Ebp2-domain-containing protein [Wallemia mellicola CBS 633.66]|uniref:Ebp2-domain-containing protein n=1 Tax=Wallemia mellicola (strain ATCC MYA-4683 / CBS 633.66) TaxID=671144 RepID=I4Y634_WALMC|nr:Ebp2-domain-containing protein [Wallemia mellicola CBS 633.66]EIM19426.1 Ebp2-domain-containing protein [Wallemia mellicola CBS 633.66]TIB71113.1 hypothetical protein E3Q23_03913 [Wallemia mellicola]TIC00413.1 Ebp2-domain-containing protein [Wallemia mellicola]TIC08367.1 Ebp2-domain-containing protein [Wallemia mellicola]|eukprot:XP_006960576.1 Ebp2-domain-containing protein [Wallemia mellicola CBS 633.66]
MVKRKEIKNVLKLDEDEDNSSEEENYDGVTEESMQKIIQLLGEDGLDQQAKDQLAYLDQLETGKSDDLLDDEAELSGEDDEDEEENDEEEDEEEEEEDSFINDAPEDEEEDASEEEEDVALEDVTGEVDEDTRAQIKTKVVVNNKAAISRILSNIKLSDKLPFIETLAVTANQSITDYGAVDVYDDLSRELAFYKQSLDAVNKAKPEILKSGTPFTRPTDFFAEMVKTDVQMEKIRQKMLDEKSNIEASERARKQRELKKVGKKVQNEKTLERQKSKKEMVDKVKSLKRKKGGVEGLDAGDDDFDIQLEDALEGGEDKKKRKMSRNARDAKFGHGGKKKYAKSNTKESTNAPFKGGKSKNSRPGKSKRMAGK